MGVLQKGSKGANYSAIIVAFVINSDTAEFATCIDYLVVRSTYAAIVVAVIFDSGILSCSGRGQD
jgi:hypothetical protein